MGAIKTAISIAIVVILVIDNSFGCTRAPKRLQHSSRTPGDNGYKIIIGDTAKGYEPERHYNLFLLGARTHEKIQQFTHFTLTAESINGYGPPAVAGPQRVGRFQLFGDSLAEFNPSCVNTVKQANDLQKTEIQVIWVAPAAGSGCVSISAMVYEGPNSWYADDGNLTQIICEKKLDSEAVKHACCACDEAKYNFVFQGIWSNETHPKDFPFAIWLTHFSDVIGASHDTNFSFWGEHHTASDGFRSLAEWGSPTLLEQELRSKGPRLRTLIKAAGLWYPHVNTNTSSHFRVDRKHHKVSLASMFGPSPDWVVGVNALDLCLEDCTWKDSLDIELYPWDAGTDNGISYMSPNSETLPREDMSPITTMYPEDPRAPFYNPHSDTMIPLAKLYIRREKLIHRNCDDEFLQALQLDVTENTDDYHIRAECEVNEYTPWTPCSVSCGKGIRMRSREYKNAEIAEAHECDRQLISKEMCVADVPECDDRSDYDDDETENLAKSIALVNEEGEGEGICKTTPWSDWSECSNTCGIGVTMRTRSFYNHIGRKKCPHITIIEKQKCMQPECTYVREELPDPICPVTIWSDWSPCSATCGKGVTIRTRIPLVEQHLQKECERRLELHQQKQCTVRENCNIDLETAREICVMPPDIGPCRGVYDRYAYDQSQRTCIPFVYGGCRGNRNNFLTSEDCMQSCDILSENTEEQLRQPNRQPQPEPRSQNNPTRPPVVESRTPTSYDDHRNQEPVDCLLSEWTDWTECSASCGNGYAERYRYVLREPRNGGLPCPKRTVKRKRCILVECTRN